MNELELESDLKVGRVQVPLLYFHYIRGFLNQGVEE